MIDTEMIEELFVGGEWVEASTSGETFDVINPANGTVLATLPDAGREEMQLAIDAAAKAQSEWAQTNAQYRAGIMREAARLMHERKEHLSRVMTLEQGKPLAESRGEIVYAASFVEWFAEEGRRVCGETVPASSPDKRILVIKTPVGVTAAITPWNKVERHVADAREKGAKVLLGGERVNGAANGGGNFFAPTVITDADDTMLVAQEETFGPVAALLPFDTEEEVIARANDTVYGLAAYYYTRDVGRVLRLAENLEYGVIGANDGMPSTAQAPFGGLKESGFGREGGHYGIEEYLDVKYVSLWAASRASEATGTPC